MPATGVGDDRSGNRRCDSACRVSIQADGTRAFYRRLGIQLLRGASGEAPARCFAAPDAYRHDDRHPSASVNLISGAWYCHACGAHGGAYDAALLRGHTPRSAMMGP